MPGYNQITITKLVNNGLTCISSGSGTNLQISVGRDSWITEPLPVLLVSL